MKKIILTLLTLTAIQHAENLDFIYQFSYGVGGDTIVEYEKGKDIDAGMGMMYGLGISFNPFENMTNLETTFVVGYSTTGSIFDHDNYYITKIPITLTESYTYAESWQFGVGMTYHTNHKGHKGDSTLENIKFDNAFGGVFSLGYVFGEEKKTSISIQATIINYDIYDASISGNRFAIMMEQKF